MMKYWWLLGCHAGRFGWRIFAFTSWYR